MAIKLKQLSLFERSLLYFMGLPYPVKWNEMKQKGIYYTYKSEQWH